MNTKKHKHEPSCPPFVTRETPDKGKGQFATRKIKEGEIIMDEHPFLTLKIGTDFGEFKTKYYPYIDDETKAKVFKLYNRIDNFKNLDPQTLEKMFSKNPALKGWILASTTEEGKFMNIFSTNSIIMCCVDDPDPCSNSREAGLYNEITVINHSCLPNVMWSWVKGDVKRQQVRAIKDIEKDEEIVANYHDRIELNYGSRQFRREEMLRVSGFWCQCSECSLQGEENERKRAEIRDKDTEIQQLQRQLDQQLKDQMMSQGFVFKKPFQKSFQKVMKLAQQRMNLVKELDIRQQFVFELINFVILATDAKKFKIPSPDPSIFKREALNYAKKHGRCQLYLCNRAFATDY